VKLALGTAQFGLDYGITNTRGRVPEDEVAAILKRAIAAGIDTIDTAALYGEAEAVLGRTIPKGAPFRIVTKSVKADTPGKGSFADRVEAELRMSLDTLKIDRLHGFLFHRAADLLSEEGRAAWRRVETLRDQGVIGRVGISITDFEIGNAVLRDFPAQLVQLPLNIVDQRGLRTGLIDRLKNRGVEIHARSPFLQGLLAIAPANMPDHLASLRRHVERMTKPVVAMGLSLKEAALGFVLGVGMIDRVVVGVASRAEFDDLVALSRVAVPRDVDFAAWAIEDPAIVDPSRWSTSR